MLGKEQQVSSDYCLPAKVLATSVSDCKLASSISIYERAVSQASSGYAVWYTVLCTMYWCVLSDYL